MRNSRHVAWRCVHNNKSCRTKGISCSATTVTTGTTLSSSLEYAKPHSHIPDPSKITALKIIDTTKNGAVVQPTVPPSNIASSNLIGVAELPEEPAGTHSQHNAIIYRGCSFQPRPTEAARNTRIVKIITSYTQATADSFLRGIAFNYMS